MTMTLDKVLPAAVLVDEGFDIDFIAGLLAAQDSSSESETHIEAPSYLPSELESQRAFMAGYEILSAFGMSI